jgi:hypothetical protein
MFETVPKKVSNLEKVNRLFLVSLSFITLERDTKYVVLDPEECPTDV